MSVAWKKVGPNPRYVKGTLLAVPLPLHNPNPPTSCLETPLEVFAQYAELNPLVDPKEFQTLFTRGGSVDQNLCVACGNFMLKVTDSEGMEMEMCTVCAADISEQEDDDLDDYAIGDATVLQTAARARFLSAASGAGVTYRRRGVVHVELSERPKIQRTEEAMAVGKLDESYNMSIRSYTPGILRKAISARGDSRASEDICPMINKMENATLPRLMAAMHKKPRVKPKLHKVCAVGGVLAPPQ